MPSLCQTFRKQAGVVWNNMSKAASKGLWLSEETLTEWVQYNIALVHQGTNFVVDLATKPQEFKHGADWEWWFTSGSNGYGFRVQAKRLFPAKYRYESLLHSKTTPYVQLEKLQKNAVSDGLIPLYCFYNFAHAPSEFAHMANQCAHVYRQPSFWGCSIAFPHDVKHVGSDRLSKLKDRMMPWHTLVCKSDKTDLVNAVGGFLQERGSEKVTAPRDVPPRIRRLMDMGDGRRTSSSATYIDRA